MAEPFPRWFKIAAVRGMLREGGSIAEIERMLDVMSMPRDASVEFECVGVCDDPPCWLVEGRFEADGQFAATVDDELMCPECGEFGQPTEDGVRVARYE